MSGIDDLHDAPTGDDASAAEYVLGTMERTARDAFAARAEREPALARMIDAWRMRLSPLADEIAPVVPPMHLWHRVRARVGLDRAPSSTHADGWWDRVAFWRGATMAGMAATAACVIALVALPREPAAPAVPASAHSALPHPVRLVTTMHDGKGRTTYMAAVDDDACTLMLMPLVKDATPGEVPQVWLVSNDGTPQSLGVGSDAPVQSMTVPDALRAHLLQGRHTLAVTMEPPGGSPAPTGFMIGKGELTRL